MCCLRNAIVEELVHRRFRTAQRRGKNYVVLRKLMVDNGCPIWGSGKYKWGVNRSDFANMTMRENYDVQRPRGYHVYLRRPRMVPLGNIGVKVRCRLEDLIVSGPYVNSDTPLNYHANPQAVFRSIEILPEDNPNVPFEMFS